MIMWTTEILNIPFYFRITFKWFEDANSVQTAANQWATDHISAIFDLDSDVLCNIIF